MKLASLKGQFGLNKKHISMEDFVKTYK